MGMSVIKKKGKIVVRKIKYFYLVTFISLFIGILNINAFSSSIGSIYQQGSSVKLNSYDKLALKYYSSTSVFCTQFKKTTPANKNISCILTTDWDDATRAGVASIIRNVGAVSITGNAPANYYYGELAINQFLYSKGYSDSIISTNRNASKILGSYKALYYDAAINAYNNVNTIKNNISVTIGSISKTEDANNFYLSATLSCNQCDGYNNARTNISGVSASISGNKISATVPKSSLNEGNNTFTFYVDVYNKEYVARNYNCGADYQTLTPNYTEFTTIATATDNESINLNKTSKGSLVIYIKDESNVQITSPNSQATYQIHQGANCTGTVVGSTVTTKSGKTEEIPLSPETYSIKEITHPSGYIESSNKCVKTSVGITAGNSTPVTINYKQDCDLKLQNLKDTYGVSNIPATELFNLYTDFPSKNNLLNMSNPSCTVKPCDKNPYNKACLKVELGNSITQNDLSCYDEQIQDSTGKYIGFCSTYFKLESPLNTLNGSDGKLYFYGKSGQFLIKQENNLIKIYDQNLNPVQISANNFATSNTVRTCYVLNGYGYSNGNLNTVYELYFGNNDDNSSADGLSKETTNIAGTPSQTSTGLTKYTYTQRIIYNLNNIYFEKMTGKYSEIKTSTTTPTPIRGVIVPFYRKSPYEYTTWFVLKGSGGIYGENGEDFNMDNLCRYFVSQEVLEIPNKGSEGKLNLKFRTVNTNSNEAFLNKENQSGRQIGSNWSKEEDRIQVLDVNNNSYNRSRSGPIYRIQLTPSDIDNIRRYNKDESYDNYKLDCDDGVCTNSFFNEFGIRRLR